ncbi:MAG: hypothetical protein NWR67_03210 [Saprospiraceae bacterium]|nr:hypothetical protein [Saprospiraceae bacterium]MDP5000033.1 hypothetical protein [Saprospiraceae bacterium]
MLQKIKLILSLVLFAAIWSNCQEPGQFQAPIGYEPVYVPIPRGPAVQVGTFGHLKVACTCILKY